jgi:serine/threonine protein kinase
MLILSGTIVKDGQGREFEVLESLGAGSFGIVFKIRNKSTSEFWALKSIQTPFTDPTTFKAFINEGNLATRISHENVIRYIYFHDGSQYPNLPPYIIMDFADGGTLRRVIESQISKKKFFSSEEIGAIFDSLIDGMEAINNVLVHRDIKPDNILIANGKPKISDFGLSKMVTEATRSTTFKGIGCLPYMAPEAWKLEKNTILMDIYSMGIIFFELATLRHPLTVPKEDILSWQEAHLYQNPQSPNALNNDLSPVISQTITRMIEKRPIARFQSWSEIRDFLGNDSITSVPNSNLVEKVLKKRMDADEKARAQQLANDKRNQEIEDLKALVSYQFKREVVEPIKRFLSDINSKYSGPKNEIDFSDNSMRASIRTFSHNRVIIEIQPILKENFYRERIAHGFGRQIRKTELCMPTYRGKQLLAWGYLKGTDGRGFNSLLLENEGEPYGTWYLLTNRSSALVREQRVSPFPFEFNEIEKELQRAGGIGLYVVRGDPLDIEFVKAFIAEYL